MSYSVKYKNIKRFMVPPPVVPETTNPPSKDTSDKFFMGSSKILEKVCCPHHKYYEWDLHADCFDIHQHKNVPSQMFQIEQQKFILEMSPEGRYSFRLYRMGPSVEDATYTWRCGIISYQFSEQGVFYEGLLDLSKELTQFFTDEILLSISSSYVHNACIGPNGSATFFLRININPMNLEKEVIPIDTEPCDNVLGTPPAAPTEDGCIVTPSAAPTEDGCIVTPPAAPTEDGCIVEKEWEMYKKVQWHTPCQSIKDCQKNSESTQEGMISSELFESKIVYKSPIFEVADQTFYLSLEIRPYSFTPRALQLYRCGPSINKTVRWWVQIKNDNADCIFASRNILLTRGCGDWFLDGHVCSFDNFSGSSYTVEFLMSKVDTVCGVIMSKGGEESPLDLDPSRTEFLAFSGKQGHLFTVHRSLLAMRVPIFEALFSREDVVEDKSGIMRVDNFDDSSFCMFLHYVDTGNCPLWNKRKSPLLLLRIIAGACILADTYLVPRLRDSCLSLLNEIATVDDEADIQEELAVLVRELASVLSTLPPETLKKWPMIESFHRRG